MRHANRMASFALVGLATFLATVAPAQAGSITSYTIVDLGNPYNLTDTSSPIIDESGNLTNNFAKNTGIYQLGVVTEPGAPDITISGYLHANGSDVNLLPLAMQYPSNGFAYRVNAMGQALGRIDGQPVIYLAATGQIVAPKWLPGDTQAPYLASINNAGQIVGTGSQPLLYSSPTAAPIALTDLLPVNSGWLLLSASDINDLGEIVGTGVNPSGQLVDYELIPTATPEPTTITILGFGSLFFWLHRSRSRVAQ
jgi:hypothetical protein